MGRGSEAAWKGKEMKYEMKFEMKCFAQKCNSVADKDSFEATHFLLDI